MTAGSIPPGRWGIDAGPGVRAHLPLEGGTDRRPAPPPPAVERLPGARVEGFAVVDAGDVTVQLGCASAPSDRWVPGLEGVVLERAMGLALAPLGVRPGALERGDPPTIDGATAVVRWSGDGGGGRRLDVAHVLAFAGDDVDAVACSALCLEPAASTRCDAIVGGLRLEGTLLPAPPPGAFARGVLWSAEHPVAAGAIVGALGVAVVTLVLARRPPRPIVRRRRPP